MHRFLWILALVGSIIAGLLLVIGLTRSSWIPHPALVSTALPVAIIPYCLARAAQELSRSHQTSLTRIEEHLGAQNEILAEIAETLEQFKFEEIA